MISLHADKFRMPCFGDRYWFYEDGKVSKGDKQVELDTTYTNCYALMDEHYQWQYVSPKEIIQYHKHLMQMFAAKLSRETEVILIRQHKYSFIKQKEK